jgi:hypothetical protein
MKYISLLFLQKRFILNLIICMINIIIFVYVWLNLELFIFFLKNEYCIIFRIEPACGAGPTFHKKSNRPILYTSNGQRCWCTRIISTSRCVPPVGGGRRLDCVATPV